MPENTTTDQPAEPQVTQGYGRRVFGGEVLNLPSGAVVRVRRPGLQALLMEGVIDQFDGLTNVVDNETIPAAKGLPPERAVDVQAVLKDPSRLTKMMGVIDKIAIACFVEPRLYPVPTPVDADGAPLAHPTEAQVDALRDDEASYVDYVPFDDKAFVMNFAVGGTRDLEQFRAESQAALGLLHDGEADGDSTF